MKTLRPELDRAIYASGFMRCTEDMTDAFRKFSEYATEEVEGDLSLRDCEVKKLALSSLNMASKGKIYIFACSHIYVEESDIYVAEFQDGSIEKIQPDYESGSIHAWRGKRAGQSISDFITAEATHGKKIIKIIRVINNYSNGAIIRRFRSVTIYS